VPASSLGPRLALMLTVLGCQGLAAQVPFDSLPTDSLQRDTVNTTEKYLAAQAANLIRLPVLPYIGVDGPRPAMSRIVLSRDSVEWSIAETLGDLLQRVPGVYLWRGGFFGRVEYPDYRSRGPGSVEYFVDGLPYIPIGPDSTGVDPSLLSLSLYSRVEIDRWPGGLRVYLFTNRHDRKAPASRIGISSGDKGIARYIASLEKRFPSGLGFAIGGERFVAPTATGTSSDYDNTQIWLQASWLRGDRFGLQAEFLRANPDRKPFVEAPDTLDQRLTGKRGDAVVRAFWRARHDQLGPRVDLLFGRTTWTGSGVDDVIRQAGAVVSWRAPSLDLTLRGFGRDGWTPLDFDAALGWSPLARTTLALEGAYQKHDRDRSTRWAGVRGSLGLPLKLTLGGSLRSGSIVAAPSILTEPEQSVTDWQATVGWQLTKFGLEVGYGRTGAFQPLPYRPYLPTVPQAAPTPKTDWLTVSWRIAPLNWLTLDGWYSDPVKGKPEGVPPTHSITQATIRNKFWHSFPSGIYDFRASIAMETWGDGIIGRDGTGQPIALDGATFFRSTLAIQLDKFTLYWDRVNLRASRKTYVPGFQVLRFGQTFGVRWDFLN
jgi:TonB-dependent receptor-like protein